MKFNTKITTNPELKKLLLFFGFILFTLFVFVKLNEIGWLDTLKNQEEMLNIIKELGLVGPIVIILLIATAIIITPIPSAPVALVSGALYGHTFGTVYVVLGALSGALIAFSISKKLGYDYVIKNYIIKCHKKSLDRKMY